jgi:peptidyl-prolyl cis-trans isomerase D
VKVEYVEVPSAPFQDKVSAADDEVRRFFDAAKERYRVPEERVLSYVLVDEGALKTRAVVTEADLLAYYQENREEWKEPEEACALHILVKVKASPTATEGHPEPEAEALAAALLARVRGGADFGELAKRASEDQGSAERGGDLGCFPRGAMVPEFENAAFALEPGQTSDLVKSGFGFHIIRLVSRREERLPELAAVKERIRPAVTAQKTEALAAEQVGLVQATLKRGTLEDAAKAISGTVATSPPFALSTPPEPLASSTLAARAFALKPGETERDGVAVTRGIAFFRLAEVKPARDARFDEVKDRVRAEVVEGKARQAARDEAQALHDRAQQIGLEKAAVAVKRERKETPSLVGRGQALGELGDGAAVEEAAFGLPEKTLSAPVRTAKGYAVLRVLERKAADPAAFVTQRATVEASLVEQKRQQLFEAYLSGARERYPVERNAAALRRALGQG